MLLDLRHFIVRVGSEILFPDSHAKETKKGIVKLIVPDEVKPEASQVQVECPDKGLFFIEAKYLKPVTHY